MLWNRKWDKPTKVEPSLDGFIAWLEQQDPATEYRWFSLKCVVGQYCDAIGVNAWQPKADNYAKVLMGGHFAADTPHTFGAALERARAHRAALTSTRQAETR